jgi:hypothetical protein
MTIRTAYATRNVKHLADIGYGKAEAAAAEQARIDALLASNPQIGKLVRKGKPVYYAAVRGLHVETTDVDALVSTLRGN